MTDNVAARLQGEFNAMLWAQAFVATVDDHPTIPTDVGTMVGWFANAIMAGYDHARRTIPELRRADDEVIVLPRDALIEFFGRMALPPWTDETGATIGSRIDCAPIASEISEWIRAHDLTGSIELRIAAGSPAAG